MHCPLCGKKMKKHDSFWLCKHIYGSVQIPIKGKIDKKPREITIGYCTECGKLVEELYNQRISGLCDECSKKKLKQLEKHLP